MSNEREDRCLGGERVVGLNQQKWRFDPHLFGCEDEGEDGQGPLLSRQRLREVLDLRPCSNCT